MTGKPASLRGAVVLAGLLLLFFLHTPVLAQDAEPEAPEHATDDVIDPSEALLDDVRGVNDENLWDGGSYQRYFETQKSILGSRRVASEALDRVGLAQDETFLDVDHIESAEKRAEAAAAVDPIERLRATMTEQGFADDEALKEVDREIKNIVSDAAEFAQNSPEPDPSELYTDVLVEALSLIHI